MFLGDRQRMVKLHVSHPMLATLPSIFSKPFFISVGSITAITIKIRSFTRNKQRFLVNCVDHNTKELVYAWCVKV